MQRGAAAAGTDNGGLRNPALHIAPVFLHSKIGAISALPPAVFHEIDTDAVFGLYIDTACLASRELIAKVGSLSRFIADERHQVLLGPDNCAHPITAKSKKASDTAQYTSSTMYAYFTADAFAELIQDTRPTFYILPNPLLLPTSLTRDAPPASDVLNCCKATSAWLSVPARIDSCEPCQALVGTTEELLDYSGEVPRPDIYADYKAVVGGAGKLLFLPYLSQLPAVHRLCRERGYNNHIVVATGDSLIPLLEALQYDSVSAITNVLTAYSDQGVAITLSLEPFFSRAEASGRPDARAAAESEEPRLKQAHRAETAGCAAGTTSINRPCLTYLDSTAHATDKEPLDAACPCLACRRPLAYLRHLYATHELTGILLVAAHNVTWLASLLRLRSLCLELHGPEHLRGIFKGIIEAFT